MLATGEIGGARLSNRVVVAPMSRVSTRGDGVATDEMVEYYADFALGGFGLVMTEGTYTDMAHSQAYDKQPGIATEHQTVAWARVAGAVHDAGGRVFLQLMHAGALVQGNHYRRVAIAPSAVQPRGEMLRRGYGGQGAYRRPRAMQRADFREVVDGFATAAHNAREAGFDGVEVHAANGYLLDQFLTAYTNQRSDQYGGSPENRARLAVDVVNAIRAAAGRDFPVGLRISQGKVNDPDYRWDSHEEAVALLAALRSAHPDYVHVASERLPWRAGTTLPSGTTVTQLARSIVGAPVIANGQLGDPFEAERVLADGQADFIALGRAALANPDWPSRVETGRPVRSFEPRLLLPEVTLANSRRRERETRGARRW